MVRIKGGMAQDMSTGYEIRYTEPVADMIWLVRHDESRRLPSFSLFFPHILLVLMRLGCRVSIDEGKKYISFPSFPFFALIFPFSSLLFIFF